MTDKPTKPSTSAKRAQVVSSTDQFTDNLQTDDSKNNNVEHNNAKCAEHTDVENISDANNRRTHLVDVSRTRMSEFKNTIGKQIRLHKALTSAESDQFKTPQDLKTFCAEFLNHKEDVYTDIRSCLDVKEDTIEVSISQKINHR
jgi:hypothetical protein